MNQLETEVGRKWTSLRIKEKKATLIMNFHFLIPKTNGEKFGRKGQETFRYSIREEIGATLVLRRDRNIQITFSRFGLALILKETMLLTQIIAIYFPMKRLLEELGKVKEKTHQCYIDEFKNTPTTEKPPLMNGIKFSRED